MGPKAKNQKMSLGNFLSDQSYGSWADEMEDMPIPSSGSSYDKSRTSYGERREFGQRSGFGDREFGGDRPYQHREQLPLPTKPPFTAHLGNLSFDVTQADIEDFFAACEVTSVRIVEDKQDRKPKGFGYVEFATIDGLKKALEFNGTQFQSRNIRVSVAEPPKDRGDTRELSDWTRKGPLPDLPGNTRRTSERGGFNRQFDAASDAGSERGPSRRTSTFEQGDGRPRDFGNWERKGPLAPAAAPAPAPTPSAPSANRVRGSERSFDRRPSPAWGEGRSQDGSRPPRPQAERVQTAAEMDTHWRTGMRTDVDPHKSPAPTPDVSTPSSPAAAPAPAPVAAAPPATRPKLNLQKRTVSEVPQAEQATPTGDSKSSPFGAARPIDTATREREVEQKRLALRQKKEQEDKEREEKRLADEKAAQGEKAAKNEQVTSPTAKENGGAANAKETGKENGASTPTTGRNYEILRRMTDDPDTTDPGNVDEATAKAAENGTIVSDPNVKPADPVQDPTTPGEAETTAEGLEEEGWSTVSKPERKRRTGNQAARAIAS